VVIRSPAFGFLASALARFLDGNHFCNHRVLIRGVPPLERFAQFLQRLRGFSCEADLPIVFKMKKKPPSEWNEVGNPTEGNGLYEEGLQFNKFILTEELCGSGFERPWLAMRPANAFENKPARLHKLWASDIPASQPKQPSAEKHFAPKSKDFVRKHVNPSVFFWGGDEEFVFPALLVAERFIAGYSDAYGPL
jgi:hypothetical protein